MRSRKLQPKSNSAFPDLMWANRTLFLNSLIGLQRQIRKKNNEARLQIASFCLFRLLHSSVCSDLQTRTGHLCGVETLRSAVDWLLAVGQQEKGHRAPGQGGTCLDACRMTSKQQFGWGVLKILSKMTCPWLWNWLYLMWPYVYAVT